MAPLAASLRQVFRRLWRAPLFTIVTLLTLAIGIGANTVVFSVVDGVLLKPLAYSHPEQLIGVWNSAPGVNIPHLTMAPFLYFVDREQNKTLEDIGIYQGDGVSLTGTSQPQRLKVVDVTDGILPLVGVKPVLGRVFTRQDDQPNAAKTVVLTYGFWQRRFGGDKSVIGRAMTLDGETNTIIGVLPQGFEFLVERPVHRRRRRLAHPVIVNIAGHADDLPPRIV